MFSVYLCKSRKSSAKQQIGEKKGGKCEAFFSNARALRVGCVKAERFLLNFCGSLWFVSRWSGKMGKVCRVGLI